MLYNISSMYFDVTFSSKQLYACIEVQFRWHQVVQDGKPGTLASCGVWVKDSVTPWATE